MVCRIFHLPYNRTLIGYIRLHYQMILIGLKGQIGVGKTTAADVLAQRFGLNDYAFAEPIKQMALLLGFTRNELYGTQDQKLIPNAHWGISGRCFLQRFGTEVCGSFLPTQIPEMENIWIRMFEYFIKDHDGTGVVVGDVRFLSESSAIRRNGGIIIEIVRATGMDTSGCSNHRSETEQSQIDADYTIENTGTLDDLLQRLNAVICRHYARTDTGYT